MIHELQEHTPADIATGTIDVIYRRRAVRDYTSGHIDRETVRNLLEAAVQAPTARDEQPWAFAIVQDKATLNRLSDNIKSTLVGSRDPLHPRRMGPAADFNAFYNASTLIVICAKPMGEFVAADCWLAAQTLMLAACSNGLGTCVIGLAVSALNTPEGKKILGIPAEMTAIAPMILGVPAGDTPPVSRKPPQILCWK